MSILTTSGRLLSELMAVSAKLAKRPTVCMLFGEARSMRYAVDPGSVSITCPTRLSRPSELMAKKQNESLGERCSASLIRPGPLLACGATVS